MMKKLMMMSLLGMVCAAGMAQETLFSSTGATYPYRIPAIATLNDGTLLTISDYRPCYKDVGNGEVDMYAKIGVVNTDGTYSWGEATRIADGNSSNGYGDAALVVDNESGDALVICVSGKVVFGSNSGHNGMARIVRSAKTGEWTLSDVSDTFFDAVPAATTMFMTSGRMLMSQTRADGAKYNRIYGALLVNGTEGEGNYVVYSDDFGETWNPLGDMCVEGGNEAKLAELPNGDLLISSRANGGRIFNVYSKTDKKWLDQSDVYNFEGNVASKTGKSGCNGELLFYKGLVSKTDNKTYNVMLQSLPAGTSGNESRSLVTVFYKAFATDKSTWEVSDFTSGWAKGLEIDKETSAYSTMTFLPNGNIGFLYEDGEVGFSYKETILGFIPTTKTAYGYDITFRNLTTEEITGGAYTANPETNINLKPHKAMSQVSCDECNSSSYSTMYLPFGVQLPEGVTAYTGSIEGDVLTIKEIKSSVVPAYTAVLLEDKQNRANIELTIVNATDKIENNDLQGTLTAIDGIDQSKYYVLGHGSSHIGFYHPNSNTLKANAAYIYIEDGAAALSIRREGATDIEEAEVAIDNEQSAIIYDLMGRRVENPTRGLYIINGKKVFVK